MCIKIDQSEVSIEFCVYIIKYPVEPQYSGWYNDQGTIWTIQVSNPGLEKTFFSSPERLDRPWAHPATYSMGTWDIF